MEDTLEVLKARILLIQYHRAYVRYRIDSGEFGDPFSVERQEIQNINGKRNNLIGYFTLQVLDFDLEDLTNALHGAMQDANSRKWGLSEEQANELYELWLHFREQLPSDWVPK